MLQGRGRHWADPGKVDEESGKTNKNILPVSEIPHYACTTASYTLPVGVYWCCLNIPVEPLNKDQFKTYREVVHGSKV